MTPGGRGKRAAALQPLSRDHLKALIAAKALREAEDAAAARLAFLDFWRDHGARHFRVEEHLAISGEQLAKLVPAVEEAKTH